MTVMMMMMMMTATATADDDDDDDIITALFQLYTVQFLYSHHDLVIFSL